MKYLKRRGFTLIELIVVMGVIATLFSFVVFDSLNAARRASVDSAVNLLVADVKQQQMAAMMGQGVTIAPFGVHFDTTSYTLFRGATYVPDAAGNFTIDLDANLEFSNPNTDLIFNPGSGEITSEVSFSVTNVTSGAKKTLTINKYGAVANLTN